MTSSETGLNAEFFRRNRDNLRQLFTGTAPIVIAANGLIQSTADTALPFKQDSNFWYLTGINEPNLILVMDKGKDYLIVPEKAHNQVLFDGQSDVENMLTTSGIGQIYDDKQGWKILSARIKKSKYAATISASPSFIKSLGFYTNPARRILIHKIKEISPNIELLDLKDHFVKLRSQKQPAELDAIRHAINITGDAISKVRRKLEKLEYEYEVEALVSQVMRSNNASHGYSPIVANGVNACTLHYVQNNGRLDRRKLLLIDVGAEVNHYSADITRTLATNPPTKRQRAVYDAVIEIQQLAFSILKAGVDLRLYEQKIAKFAGEKLREIGLGKSITEDSVRKYYPHATSHFLGLDVHDVGQYDKPLQPGMVITVEPGIYIPEENIGIRIEDDALITETGIEILSRKITKSL